MGDTCSSLNLFVDDFVFISHLKIGTLRCRMHHEIKHLIFIQINDTSFFSGFIVLLEITAVITIRFQRNSLLSLCSMVFFLRLLARHHYSMLFHKIANYDTF